MLSAIFQVLKIKKNLLVVLTPDIFSLNTQILGIIGLLSTSLCAEDCHRMNNGCYQPLEFCELYS